MIDRPRPLLGLSLALLAVLALAGSGARPVAIAPADAPLHEGREVRLAGVVAAVRAWGDAFRLDVARDASALAVVLAPGAEPPALGQWVEAEGRLARERGELVLRADSWTASRGPAPERPAWDAVAADPGRFAGRLLRVEGTVEGGELHLGEGRTVRLGRGAWPPDGRVSATGTLAWEGSCLCHVLHAARVAAWTS